MSYPAPPPPGQGDSAGQSGPAPYQPNPYATGGSGSSSPYGQPPKKDNSTLWWILGGIGVLLALCCIGVCGFFGWAAYVAEDEISSATSDVSNAEASAAEEISEGSQATDNGATVLDGWFITSDDELSGISLRNDGSSRNMLNVKFYFMEDGDVVEDASCTSDFVDPGETDYSPTCLDPIKDISGYDEIRYAEGN